MDAREELHQLIDRLGDGFARQLLEYLRRALSEPAPPTEDDLGHAIELVKRQLPQA